MSGRRALGPLTAALLALVAARCAPEPQAAPPDLGEGALRHVRAVSSEARDALEQARRELAGSPAEAGASLDRAAAALARLDGFYLPLLAAREGAGRALALVAARQPEAAGRELVEVEATLVAMAEGGAAPAVDREVQNSLGLVVGARVAAEASSPAARAQLEQLIAHLDDLLLKGELVVAGG